MHACHAVKRAGMWTLEALDYHHHSHQQTGFTAGTVADDDELSADFSHGDYSKASSGLVAKADEKTLDKSGVGW